MRISPRGPCTAPQRHHYVHARRMLLFWVLPHRQEPYSNSSSHLSMPHPRHAKAISAGPERAPMHGALNFGVIRTTTKSCYKASSTWPHMASHRQPTNNTLRPSLLPSFSVSLAPPRRTLRPRSLCTTRCSPSPRPASLARCRLPERSFPWARTARQAARLVPTAPAAMPPTRCSSQCAETSRPHAKAISNAHSTHATSPKASATAFWLRRLLRPPQRPSPPARRRPAPCLLPHLPSPRPPARCLSAPSATPM